MPEAVTEPPALSDEPPARPQAQRSARSARTDNRDDVKMAEGFSEEVLTMEPPMATTDNARGLRLNPQVAILKLQTDQAIEMGDFDRALESINAALTLPSLHRFETARLWRTKARILTQLGRETDAQHARKTAAKLDPTR